MSNKNLDLDSLTTDKPHNDGFTTHSEPNGDCFTDDKPLDGFTVHKQPQQFEQLQDCFTGDKPFDGFMKLKQPEQQQVSVSPTTNRSTVSSATNTKIAALDWERDGWRVSYNGQPSIRVSKSELLNLAFDEVDVVIVEQAHMRERNVYSVAQVYTEDELRQLKFTHKLKMFPGTQTYKASEFAGNIKENGDPDKELDAESIAIYSAAHPTKLASWKLYSLPGEDKSRHLWNARDNLRNEIKEALNPLRSAWNKKKTAEKYELPEVKLFCRLLDSVFDDLTDGIKEQFGIKRTKQGDIRVEKMSAAITVWLAVYDRNGNLRRNPRGGFIGVKFILGAIGLSHSYQPNMARSQLTWHGMRHYKGGREGGKRSEYMLNLRNFIAIMRDGNESEAV